MLLLAISAAADDWDKGWDAFMEGDYVTALRELQPFAEQGDALAQFYLGMLHDLGGGVPQDYSTAHKCYSLAAEQGGANAQTHLGDLYALGNGVIQDNAYAHMWYNIAASTGDPTAKLMRYRIEKKMTPAQIAEAQKLARECVKKNYKDC